MRYKTAATSCEDLCTDTRFVFVYFVNVHKIALFILIPIYCEHVIFLFLPFSHISLLPFFWLHSLPLSFSHHFFLIDTHVEKSHGETRQVVFSSGIQSYTLTKLIWCSLAFQRAQKCLFSIKQAIMYVELCSGSVRHSALEYLPRTFH